MRCGVLPGLWSDRMSKEFDSGGRRLFRKCRPRAKIAACLHLEVPFRTISTRPGRIVRKGPPVGPAAVYRPVAGTLFSEWDRSMDHMSNFKMDLV